MVENKENKANGRVCQVDKEELLLKLEKILYGIDTCETEDDNGWWETDTGASFGRRKLNQIRKLVQEL